MIAALGLALLYGLGVARVRRWPVWRTLAFALGLLPLAFVTDDAALPAHMAEHLLLTVVSAPLIVLGAPHVLSIKATTGEARSRLVRLLNRVPSPLPLLLLFTATQVAVHVTPFFDYANDHPIAHATEHAALFGTAILFWVPVLAAPPARTLGPLARVAYLFAAMAPMGVVGAAFGGEAGAIMWIGGGYALLVVVLAAVWSGLAQEERRQAARERYR
jgi:putative membrane protein